MSGSSSWKVWSEPEEYRLCQMVHSDTAVSWCFCLVVSFLETTSDCSEDKGMKVKYSALCRQFLHVPHLSISILSVDEQVQSPGLKHLDKLFAFPCFVPWLYSTSKLYADRISIHHATLPVGSFSLKSHTKAWWSDLTKMVDQVNIVESILRRTLQFK